jgi:putative dimethyl sulfoxide reductase chaperone
MTPQQTALAHSRAYHLFSQMMLFGMTDDLLPIVNNLPDFTDTEAKSADDWKADHYALFGMSVFPFETVFLAEDGLLGGTVTESVTHAYYEAGYQSDDSETADHIGNELGLMAFLCGAESDAREDEVVQAIYHTIQLQRQFLDNHLLCWLPSLVLAIHQQGDEAFSVIADLVLDLVLKHRQSLYDDPMHPTQPLILPATPNILDDGKTGLKDIADFLLTPVYTGHYLSRNDITRIGGQFRLPSGFGKRHQMLTNLLSTAVDYATMDNLIGALQDEVNVSRNFYIQRVTDKRVSDAWVSRLDETTQFLQVIQDALV